MAKNDDFIRMRGTVTERRPGGHFDVTLENGHDIHATVNGKIRKNNIMIYVGDEVDVEMSPYDLTLGRITFRHKG